jgi:ketoreductase RED1
VDADAVQENVPSSWTSNNASSPGSNRPPAPTRCCSTSGIRATRIAEAMKQPGRLVVGHPFNPPHLIPLVEVVPGERTDPAVVRRAVAFYTALGKKPQVLHREVPAFVANRLQAAHFREAVHLIAQGVVTEQELDSVVTSSIGLRWAVAGPFRTFQLGGGPGGLPYFLKHLGPGLESLWQDLGSPRLDQPTVELLGEQARGDESVAVLAAERDQAQIKLMQALGQTPPDDLAPATR